MSEIGEDVSLNQMSSSVCRTIFRNLIFDAYF